MRSSNILTIMLLATLLAIAAAHMPTDRPLLAATKSTAPAPAPTPTPTPSPRWNRGRSSGSPSHGCEYREMMSSLHDRVGILATLDEDLRNRLESIDKKLHQMETAGMSRMDSLNVGQMDLLKRLDSMELIQRMSRREIEELREVARQVRRSEFVAPPPAERLDSLAILLTSTFNLVGQLQSQLSSNITRLMQATSQLQRRLNNIQRRQNGNGQGWGLALGPQQAVAGSFFAPTALAPATGTGTSSHLVTSCAQGVPTTAGILRLQLTAHSQPFYVLCDERSYGGGWTVIQNRFNGDVSFQRDWFEYRNGFGNLAGEFFIGLEKLHALTASAVHELIVVLEDFRRDQRYARYNLFAIGDEHESYVLKLLGTYNGTAGDALTYHAGSKFSTFDRDNDGCPDCNCAQSHMGAWWYNWCEMSNLNGKYFASNYNNTPTYQGMYWHSFHGPKYSLKSVRMMIRPAAATADDAEEDNRR